MNKDITLTKNLTFNPIIWLELNKEYPYQWVEKDEKGITHFIFSKKPKYTLLEFIEMKNKIKELGWYE